MGVCAATVKLFLGELALANFVDTLYESERALESGAKPCSVCRKGALMSHCVEILLQAHEAPGWMDGFPTEAIEHARARQLQQHKTFQVKRVGNLIEFPKIIRADVR